MPFMQAAAAKAKAAGGAIKNKAGNLKDKVKNRGKGDRTASEGIDKIE
jgi:hypothetical protein